MAADSGNTPTMVALASMALFGIGATPYDERGLIALARASVAAEVRGERVAALTTKTPPRPVFVTIEVGGVVRGCRGDLATRAKSLEEEVVLAARAAATHDPKYRPLSPAELGRFLVTVTIVERIEPITGVAGLRPEDGLVLRSGGRTGVVLPWEGKDPDVRKKWAYRKAGVGTGAPVALFRLIAQRFRG